MKATATRVSTFVLVFALTLTSVAAAEKVDVKGYDEALSSLTVDTRVAPREAPLGGEITFTVKVDHGGDGSVGFASPYTGGTLVVKSTGQHREGRATVVEVVMAGFELGSVEVPPFQLRWTDAEGADHAFAALGGKVEIVPSAPENAQPADFAPAVEISGWNPLFFIALGMAVSALILGAVLWRRRRNRQPAAPPEPLDARSPGQIALEEIDRLQVSGLLEKGEIKTYTYTLDDIVRRFIIRSVGRGELSETSDELLRALEPVLSLAHASALREFFERGDRVRFAGSEHAPEEAKLLCESAIALIRRMSKDGQGAGVSP